MYDNGTTLYYTDDYVHSYKLKLEAYHTDRRARARIHSYLTINELWHWQQARCTKLFSLYERNAVVVVVVPELVGGLVTLLC